MSALGSARLLAQRVYWRLFLAPRGRGRHFSADHWDDQYRAGTWNYLESLDQLGHYAVIAGFVRRLSPSGTILEMGCGNGLLLRELQ